MWLFIRAVWRKLMSWLCRSFPTLLIGCCLQDCVCGWGEVFGGMKFVGVIFRQLYLYILLLYLHCFFRLWGVSVSFLCQWPLSIYATPQSYCDICRPCLQDRCLWLQSRRVFWGGYHEFGWVSWWVRWWGASISLNFHGLQQCCSPACLFPTSEHAGFG